MILMIIHSSFPANIKSYKGIKVNITQVKSLAGGNLQKSSKKFANLSRAKMEQESFHEKHSVRQE